MNSVDNIYNKFVAKILLKLNKHEEAEAIFREQLDRNPENWEYYGGLEEAVRAGMFVLYSRWQQLSLVEVMLLSR